MRILLTFTLLIGVFPFEMVYGLSQLATDTILTQSTDTILVNHSSEHKSLPNDTKKSKITPGLPQDFDWIKLMDGKEMEVEVRKMSEKYLFYSEPGVMDMKWIDRREVQTIYYRSGRVEQMTQYAVEIKEIREWQSVAITRNPEDVEDMIRVENVSIKQEATTRHHYYRPATLEASAEIILRRQAALLDADIVLVVSVEQRRSYGDPPEVIMTGVAYKKR